MRRYLFLAVLIFAALGCSKDDTVSSGSAPAAGESVTVTNKANEADATINTLSATIAKIYGSDFEYQNDKVIKVLGTINSADFESLRSFVSVDLSEVTIVGDVTVEPYYIIEDPDGVTVTEVPAVVVKDGSAIPAQAFATRDGESSKVKKVILSDKITFPGNESFKDCVDLIVVEGGKITSIASSAFEGCTNLESVTELISNIGADGTIGARAFYGCSIKTLTIPAAISKIGDEAFNFNQTDTDYLDGTDYESVTVLGDAIPELGNDVFPDEFARSYADAGYRRYVKLLSTNQVFADFEPKGWDSINLENEAGTKTDDLVVPTVAAGKLYGAVADVMGGTYAAPYSIIVSEGIVNAEDINQVLKGVAKFDLAGATIENNRIPESSFAGSAASPVSVGMSLSSVSSSRAETGANRTLVSAVLPKNTEVIEAKAFQYCEKLFEVKLSDSSDDGMVLYEIGDNAFDGCWALTQESFANMMVSTKTIGKESFQSCFALTDIVIPMSVTSIGDGAFEFCDKVESITVSWVGGVGSEVPAVTATSFPSKFLKDGGDGSAIKVPDMKGKAYEGVEGWDLYNVYDGTSPDPTVVAPSKPGGLNDYMKFRFGDDYLDETIDKVVVQGYILVTGARQSDGTYIDGEINEVQQYLANVKELDLSEAKFVCDAELNTYMGTAVNASGVSNYQIIPNGTFKSNLVWERIVLPLDLAQTSSQSFNQLNCNVTGCTNLRELVMPPVATATGWEFAKDCTSLESLGEGWLENVVTRVGEYSFKNTGFTEVVLGASTPLSGTEIPVLVGAFQNCAKLKKVTIRDNAKAYVNLAKLSFDGCTAIEEFIFEVKVGTLPKIASTALPTQFKKAATSIYTVTVPSGMEETYQKLSLTDGSGTVTKVGDAYCFVEADLEVGKEKDQPGEINGVEMMYCADRLFELVEEMPLEERESIKLMGKVGTEDWAYIRSFVDVDLTEAKNSAGGTFTNVPANSFLGGENSDPVDPYKIVTYEDLRTVNLKLPATITTFESGSFKYNLVIENIEVAEGTSTFTIAGSAFSLSWNTTNSDERVLSAETFKHIVERSTNIGGWAGTRFTNDVVDEIHLHEKLTSIGSNAFEQVTVTAIYCPWESVAEFPTMVGGNAFAGCTFYINKNLDIEELKLKDKWGLYTIEHIPDGPGYSINGAEKIDVPADGLGSVAGIDDLAAADDSSIVITGNPDIATFDWATVAKFKNVDFSANESYTEIPASMFASAAMTSVTLPATITAIGDSAFGNCSALATVNVSSAALTIGNSSFSGCSALSTESVAAIAAVTTSYGDNAFYGCSSVASVTFPTTVTAIGEGAFSGCSALESIVLTYPSETQFPTVSATTFPSQFLTDGGKSITVDYAVKVAGLPEGWSNYYVTNGEKAVADHIVYVTSVGGLNQALINEYDENYLSETKDYVKIIGYVVISETATENEVQTCLNNVKDLDLSEAVMVMADGSTYENGTNINVPGVTFKNLTNLTKLTMPTSLTTTVSGTDAKLGCGVTGCTNLTTVVTSGAGLGWEFAKNVTTLKYLGADQTASNAYIYSIRKLDGSALYNTAVEQLTFGPTLEIVAGNAANGCTALTTVTFDNTGTTAPQVTDNAFANCDNLVTIEFKGTTLPSKISPTAFPTQFTKADEKSNQYITVPEDQIAAYKAIVLTDGQIMGDVYRFADDAVDEYKITETEDDNGKPVVTIDCWSKTPLFLKDLILETSYATTSGPIDATLVVKGLVGVLNIDASEHNTKPHYNKFQRVDFKDAEITFYSDWNGTSGTAKTPANAFLGQEFSYNSTLVSVSLPTTLASLSWNVTRSATGLTDIILNSADAASLPTVETTSLCIGSDNAASTQPFMREYVGAVKYYVTIPQNITFEEAAAVSNWGLYNLQHPDGTRYDGTSAGGDDDDTTLAELQDSYTINVAIAGDMEAWILANSDLKNWYKSTEETTIATKLIVTGKLNSTDFTALQKFSELDLSAAVVDGNLLPASAFKSNAVLTKITLPTSLVEIGASAFQGSIVAEVVMGENLKIINSSAFQSCSKMNTPLNVPSAQFTYLGGNVFNGSYVLGGAENAWVLSKELTFVGEWALSAWGNQPLIYLQWTTAEELDAVTFSKADATEPENFAPQKYHLDTTATASIMIPFGTKAIYEAKFTNLSFEEMEEGASVPTVE